MALTVQRFRSAAALVFVLGLLNLLSSAEPAAQGQSDCTVTVQPGQPIQQAIDAAPEGAVICLTAGTWEENIKINKLLTLRGMGQEQTKITGKGKDEPVIEIFSEAEIAVGIEGLTVAEAKRADGILIIGKARATISGSQISGNEWGGIELWDSTQATISGSQVSDNGAVGIWLRGSAQATISSSQLLDNGDVGIVLSGSAQATISGSQLSGNSYGIWLWDLAQATISDSQVLGNGFVGIVLVNSAQATISDSQVSGNGTVGIVLLNSTQATIIGSTIEGNGKDEDCKRKDWLCNGIFVSWKSRLKLVSSKVFNNTDWGVGAALKQCRV